MQLRAQLARERAEGPLDLVVGGVTYTAANYFRFTAGPAGVYRISNCTSTTFDSILVRLGACGQGASALEVNDALSLDPLAQLSDREVAAIRAAIERLGGPLGANESL